MSRTGPSPGRRRPDPDTPPRGRPRSEKAHQAILAAAAELLLARGLSAVSMDSVADRAGVSKATIYRWWPSKETLALDALYTEWAAAGPHSCDTGSLRGDLVVLLSPWARLASSRPYGRVVAALLTEAHTDPAFAAEYRGRLVEPRRIQARAVFRRAIDRGEIPADTDIEMALDLLYGPLYHRLLHGHAPLSDRFVREIIDTVLGGVSSMPDSPDSRVATAMAHWAPRFTANGTDYADVIATVDRVGRWADWCREWGRTAQGYEDLARRAEEEGRTVTAAQAWRRAALCWHWGKFVFTEDPEQQRTAHDRAVDCFRRAAGSLSPPAEFVHVPYQDGSLAAYLRIPDAAEPPPVVIMVPGLDSVKEELQATAEYLLRRGLAVLAIDGPGQGEAEYDLPIEPEYERVTAAAIDCLRGLAGIDPNRIAIFGVSLGGYYAARSLAREPRLRAGVALSGPYRFDRDWDDLPPQTRATFARRSRSAGPHEARRRAGELTLENHAGQINRPLLVVHGRADRLIPAAHAQWLADNAPGAELVMYDDGNHGLTNRAFESRSLIADWLTDHLRS